VAIFGGHGRRNPKKHLSLIPTQKQHVFYFKHASKLVKIENLATRCQDASPKNFKYGWSLSYELGKALQKKNRDLVVSEIHRGHEKIRFFLFVAEKYDFDQILVE
jgi:hypothetical protein